MPEEEVEQAGGEELDELIKSLEDAENRIEALEFGLERDARDHRIVLEQKNAEIQALADKLEGILVQGASSAIFLQELRLLKNDRRWDLFKQLVTEECFSNEEAARKLLSQVDLMLKWYGEMKT